MIPFAAFLCAFVPLCLTAFFLRPEILLFLHNELHVETEVGIGRMSLLRQSCRRSGSTMPQLRTLESRFVGIRATAEPAWTRSGFHAVCHRKLRHSLCADFTL